MHFPRNSMTLAWGNHYDKWEMQCIMLTTVSSEQGKAGRGAGREARRVQRAAGLGMLSSALSTVQAVSPMLIQGSSSKTLPRPSGTAV